MMGLCWSHLDLRLFQRCRALKNLCELLEWAHSRLVWAAVTEPLTRSHTFSHRNNSVLYYVCFSFTFQTEGCCTKLLNPVIFKSVIDGLKPEWTRQLNRVIHVSMPFHIADSGKKNLCVRLLEFHFTIGLIDTDSWNVGVPSGTSGFCWDSFKAPPQSRGITVTPL